uniref:Uncharacterized protein n=1 Tax=Ciona intestinalis TaxID=7719 RepID=H2Y1R3_CIOIN
MGITCIPLRYNIYKAGSGENSINIFL